MPPRLVPCLRKTPTSPLTFRSARTAHLVAARARCCRLDGTPEASTAESSPQPCKSPGRPVSRCLSPRTRRRSGAGCACAIGAWGGVRAPLPGFALGVIVGTISRACWRLELEESLRLPCCCVGDGREGQFLALGTSFAVGLQASSFAPTLACGRAWPAAARPPVAARPPAPAQPSREGRQSDGPARLTLTSCRMSSLPCRKLSRGSSRPAEGGPPARDGRPPGRSCWPIR